MYGTGSILVALSMIPTPPASVNRGAILGVAALAAATAVLVLVLGQRYTETLSHVASFAGSLLVSLIVALAGGSFMSIVYGVFLVWVAQYAAVFYSPRAAAWHGATAAAAHAVALSVLPPTHAVTTWAVLTGTCQIVLLCHRLVDRFSARLRGLVERSGGVVLVVDPDLSVKYQGGPFERLLGYRSDELVATSLLSVIHRDDAAHALRVVSRAMESEDSIGSFEARLRRGDGSWLYTEASVESALDDPSIKGVVLTIRDITERKRLEAQLTHQAFHDGLTSLPNRALFRDRVEHALARSARTGWSPAVLFIDLDDFKSVNDGLGHGCGDDLLVAVAKRLVAGLRSADTVARLGGDEFAILIEDAADTRDPVQIAERLLEALGGTPVLVDGGEVFVTASIGIATCQSGLEDVDDLLRAADAAMYSAKRGGKGRAEQFRPGMHEHLVRRLQLKTDLRRALERGQFHLVYQPTFSLRDRSVQGVEALIRWDHPELGRIAPLDFIPLAEETGQIVEIGRWVLGEACRQAAAWRREKAGVEELSMSVNVSARQLEDDTLVADVEAALEASGLGAAALVLEITESVLLANLEQTLGHLEKLRALGVRVAIDDFGTGYSSLSYLNRLPVDVLKIDKTFVDQLQNGVQQRAVVETIVRFGQLLGVQTVAEGIEETAQLEELRDAECDLGQGYVFAPPMPARDVVRMLGSGPAETATRNSTLG